MRYVGFAALAATFWLTVATLRLALHPPARHRIASAPPPVPFDSSSRRERRLGAYEVEPWSGCSLPVGDERGALGDLAHLHWSALSAGMDAVKPEVDACRVKYGVAGTAVVKVRIAVDGSVRSAEVISPLTGTPTAACVEAAVKTARFVPSKGLVTSYPFQLR